MTQGKQTCEFNDESNSNRLFAISKVDTNIITFHLILRDAVWDVVITNGVISVAVRSFTWSMVLNDKDHLTTHLPVQIWILQQ